MPVIVEDGIVKAITDLKDLSGTTPVVLYECKPANRKFAIKKLIIYNQDTADHEVILGEYDTTHTTWNKDKVIVKVAAGEMKVLTEDELPADFVMTTDPAIMAWAAKLATSTTANNVKIKAEFWLE